jgi:hypothetical protein
MSASRPAFAPHGDHMGQEGCAAQRGTAHCDGGRCRACRCRSLSMRAQAARGATGEFAEGGLRTASDLWRHPVDRNAGLHGHVARGPSGERSGIAGAQGLMDAACRLAAGLQVDLPIDISALMRRTGDCERAADHTCRRIQGARGFQASSWRLALADRSSLDRMVGATGIEPVTPPV